MADPEPVDLDFLADRLRYLIAEVASLRDGMSVLTAMVLRQDGTMNALLQEIRATHFADRADEPTPAAGGASAGLTRSRCHEGHV